MPPGSPSSSTTAVIEADRVIAVVGKTEGNGGVNDYTRIIADHEPFVRCSSTGAPGRRRKSHQIPVLWSGGTDGVLSPHAAIFATVSGNGTEPSDEPRLSVGSAMSERSCPRRSVGPRWSGRSAAGVRVAMERAGITSPKDVHYVQTKTPLLTLPTINEAKSRGHAVFTEDTLHSMDVSNGTSALGIAVALGEIEMPTAEQIMTDLSLYSAVASCSSGSRVGSGPDRRRRQRARHRRPLPHRPFGDARRAGRRRASGTRSAPRDSSSPIARAPRI